MDVKKLLVFLLSFSSILTSVSFADDTELYVYESTSRTGSKPQVLIIFDNSGSMGTRVYNVAPEYTPSHNTGNTLFYTKGGINSDDIPNPNSHSETRKFSRVINGCETSKRYLEEFGFFTGFFREYSFTGQNGTWKELPDNDGSTIRYLDCFEDIQNNQYRNASGVHDGLPIDSAGNKSNPQRYIQVTQSSNQTTKDIAAAQAANTEFGTGRVVTLYTEEYARWRNTSHRTTSRTRMDLAKEAITNVVLTTPSVDFGLAVFNLNSPSGYRNGGRIISGIKSMTAQAKLDLLETVEDIPYAQNTPLCETLYEAYRYFAGKSVLYGDDDSSYGYYNVNNTPPRDFSVISGGYYDSPFEPPAPNVKQCQNQAYIIYITDGSPTADTSADSRVRKLTGGKDKHSTSYLSSLSSWMSKNDVNPTEEGKQTVITYTIGFSSGANRVAPLLTYTAEKGGGKYVSAQNATELQTVLQKFFSEILETNASFTSPSIASNNFNRTRTFDSAYYSMFLPNKGPRWAGNIKKFKVTGSGDVVDRNNQPVIGADGNIKPTACSYWTSSSLCSGGRGDGPDVLKGGVAQMLQATHSRTLYGNFHQKGGLTPFTKGNAVAATGGGEQGLANYMGVEKSELVKLFQWAQGRDVDDEDKDGAHTDKRTDIMGDPLHSKPLAINFGSEDAPDIRILVGTNHGFLHMFKDEGDTVKESWAFMPYELLPNLRELRNNVPSGVHSVYGLDGSPVAHIKSGPGGITQAWAYIGMRRGGTSYYAFDITNPDKPSLKWMINSDSPGMSNMGESWAQPVITKIPGWPVGNTNPSTAKPVLIFGAGYEPTNKDGTGVGARDTKGKGVYIVDADTGKLVHFFGDPAGASGTNLPGIIDSVPNSVAILDSDNDGLTDRIYATDTGANVWRIDMPSPAPKGSLPWTGFKFADLGGNSTTSDRRFYSAPVAVQTIITNYSEVSTTINGKTSTQVTSQKLPYDAVVIGSGLRPSPSSTSRNDMFFTLQDRNTVSRPFNGSSTFPTPAPLTINDLYNISSGSPETQQEKINFSKKRGWYYGFGTSGEKSLSAATIIGGRVIFTTYVPGNAAASNQCLIAGRGNLYSFDLHWGRKTYTRIALDMGERVPDTPQLVIPPNGNKDSYMYLIGIGNAGEQMQKYCPADDPTCKAPEDALKNCQPGDRKCLDEGPGAQTIYYYLSE